MNKPNAGPDAGNIILAVVVILVAAYATGVITITHPVSAGEPIATVITTTSVDVLAAANGAVVTPLAEVTPRPLPPSHSGGMAPIQVRLAQASRGIPDKSVYATAPSNAEIVQAIFSYYWPNLGGTNCSRFVEDSFPSYVPIDFPNADTTRGWCWSKMSSGERWEYYRDRAVACPDEYPFGTKVYAFGREWICLDRGGAIISTPDGDWIDFLTPNPPIGYRTHFDIWVVYP